MQPALTFQFERAVNEYARWQAVPLDERSDAPAWWWSTALAAIDETATMPVEWCAILGVADESTYAKGAEVSGTRSSDKHTCRGRKISAQV
jgi:hypothetical protein